MQFTVSYTWVILVLKYSIVARAWTEADGRCPPSDGAPSRSLPRLWDPFHSNLLRPCTTLNPNALMDFRRSFWEDLDALRLWGATWCHSKPPHYGDSLSVPPPPPFEPDGERSVHVQFCASAIEAPSRDTRLRGWGRMHMERRLARPARRGWACRCYLEICGRKRHQSGSRQFREVPWREAGEADRARP